MVSNCYWTGYVNQLDGNMNYNVPDDRYRIMGVDSYHSNKKEDRQWQFKVCQVSVSVRIFQLQRVLS